MSKFDIRNKLLPPCTNSPKSTSLSYALQAIFLCSSNAQQSFSFNRNMRTNLEATRLRILEYVEMPLLVTITTSNLDSIKVAD